MKRLYEHIISEHFSDYKQMIVLNGPRQVGKTTLSKNLEELSERFIYLNWDIKEDREVILQGQRHLAKHIGLEHLAGKTLLIFDELHKHSQWKSFLKGFYDAFQENCHILVTGSQRLNISRKTGDSLMGRYFPFRIHPFSVGECLKKTPPVQCISQPQSIDQEMFDALWKFGGYPDPFLKQDQRFLTRWHELKETQLLREDIRDLTQIQEVDQIEILVTLLKQQAGQLINYSNLSNKIQVTSKTIQKWICTLENFYYCFRIRPWSKNITRSLLKEPKLYLWDWSLLSDIGAKAENFIASQLLKSVHFWTDYGFGRYELYFLRTKDKKEVDFLVTENDKPWFLVEVKYGKNHGLSPSLSYFQQKTQAQHAFQVVFDAEYVDIDCFTKKTPVIVPAKTFLSQLI